MRIRHWVHCGGGEDSSHGVQRAMRLIQRLQRGFVLPSFPGGEDVFQRLTNRLNFGEVHRARGSLKTVRGAEHSFNEAMLFAGHRCFLQCQQPRPNHLQVLISLDPECGSKRFEEFVFPAAHVHYTW